MICVIRGFLVAYGKKSLEEIFFKEWPGPEIIYHSAYVNIIFKNMILDTQATTG